MTGHVTSTTNCELEVSHYKGKISTLLPLDNCSILWSKIKRIWPCNRRKLLYKKAWQLWSWTSLETQKLHFELLKCTFWAFQNERINAETAEKSSANHQLDKVELAKRIFYLLNDAGNNKTFRNRKESLH